MGVSRLLSTVCSLALTAAGTAGCLGPAALSPLPSSAAARRMPVGPASVPTEVRPSNPNTLLDDTGAAPASRPLYEPLWRVA